VTDLIRRYEKNPILTAKDWPYRIHTVFNPGATRLQDGRILLLCRCEDHRGPSHLTTAISKDGLTDWEIDTKPTMVPEYDQWPEEIWGVEDARIVFVEDIQKYVITYTAYSRKGPGVAIALTDDFKTFERKGMIMHPDDKDAAVFPRKFGDEYAMIHRVTHGDRGHMWISWSRDFCHWGNSKELLHARKGGWWDAGKIGLCGPPIETKEGWLVLYHGVRRHASGSIYRVGAVLFDLEDPHVVVARGDSWIMGPETDYEINGDVPYVCFPCGQVALENGDDHIMYFGGADTVVGAAFFKASEIVDWLKTSPKTYPLEADFPIVEGEVANYV
jgi:predicted GH43/DUF377 family glycosyl hydrolase